MVAAVAVSVANSIGIAGAAVAVIPVAIGSAIVHTAVGVAVIVVDNHRVTAGMMTGIVQQDICRSFPVVGQRDHIVYIDIIIRSLCLLNINRCVIVLHKLV